MSNRFLFWRRERRFDQLGRMEAKLDYIVNWICTEGRRLMTGVTEIKQLVTDINDETNAVATKVDAQGQAIADLKAQLAAGTPVSQADLDAIASGLGSVSDRLKAIGANPDEPIPPPA
jgi:hypothetical protein